MQEIIANELGYRGKIIFTEHHESHAASIFFFSPYPFFQITTLKPYHGVAGYH